MIQGTPLFVLATSQLGAPPQPTIDVRSSLPPLSDPLWGSHAAFGGSVELDPRAYEALVYAAHRHESELALLKAGAFFGGVAVVGLIGACLALAIVTWRLSRRGRAPGT